MSPTEEDLRECAGIIANQIAAVYRRLTGNGEVLPDLLMPEVVYQLLAAGMVEVGPNMAA